MSAICNTHDLSLRCTKRCWGLVCRRGDKDFPRLRSLIGDWALDDFRICHNELQTSDLQLSLHPYKTRRLTLIPVCMKTIYRAACVKMIFGVIKPVGKQNCRMKTEGKFSWKRLMTHSCSCLSCGLNSYTGVCFLPHMPSSHLTIIHHEVTDSIVFTLWKHIWELSVTYCRT